MDTYLDFGSQTIRWMRNGAVFQEPAMIAWEPDSCRPLAFGHHAELLALKPELNARIGFPLQNKEYPTDDDISFLRYFQAKMPNDSYHLIIADDTSEQEQNLIRATFAQAGFSPLKFVKLLHALNDFVSPGTLIVHSGARRTHLGFFEDGVLKLSRSRLWGGRTLDISIRDAVREKNHLEIGPQTAEMLKFAVGRDHERMVRGLDPLSRMPRDERISMTICEDAFKDDLLFLGETIHSVMESAKGIQYLHLSGGMANGHFLRNYLKREFAMPIFCDHHPELTLLNNLIQRKED